MEDLQAFSVLQEAAQLPKAMLFWGDFNYAKQEIFELFKKRGIDLTKPGHYIMHGGVFNMDSARELHNFYSKQIHDDQGYSVIVIAPDTFKVDAQQVLLKMLEELRNNCFFVLFLYQNSFVLPTIKSRLAQYMLGPKAVKGFDTIHQFVTLSPAKRLEKIAKDTKNFEGPEIRIYTESMVRELCEYYYAQGIDKNKEPLCLLLEAAHSLSLSRTAPKFILDYIATIL